ncbi:MAG TPA: alternative ribosome rescue aminoacyl-tRNA hydrolase ArfB [Polyangiaceae bacterium]|jgi:ribosome-associated protein|nr:alternative ribosome rescue aminoacyl-tRNA hydrolase ArfB [Polyangiaceae bacterium]
MADPLVVSAALTVPANELHFTSVRASGPGGQNVNKVSSKVELRFNFERSKVLGDEMKTRLRLLARGRLDAEGQIMIASQLTRDRQRNLEDARQKLVELLVAAARRPKRRRPTKPSRGAKETRLREKRHISDRKRNRGSRTESE